jgi:hypothetical protein
VQDVEATVGEHHAAAVAFLAAKPQNRLVQCENCRTVQGISMQAQRRMRTTLPEPLVYHASEQQCLQAGQARYPR